MNGRRPRVDNHGKIDPAAKATTAKIKRVNEPARVAVSGEGIGRPSGIDA